MRVQAFREQFGPVGFALLTGLQRREGQGFPGLVRVLDLDFEGGPVTVLQRGLRRVDDLADVFW